VALQITTRLRNGPSRPDSPHKAVNRGGVRVSASCLNVVSQMLSSERPRMSERSQAPSAGFQRVPISSLLSEPSSFCNSLTICSLEDRVSCAAVLASLPGCHLRCLDPALDMTKERFHRVEPRAVLGVE